MDVDIDTSQITDGIASISNTIRILDNCVSLMKNQLALAGEEFTTNNYGRASDSILHASQSLDVMDQKLNITKSFLYKLVGQIDEYTKLKF